RAGRAGPASQRPAVLCRRSLFAQRLFDRARRLFHRPRRRRSGSGGPAKGTIVAGRIALTVARRGPQWRCASPTAFPKADDAQGGKMSVSRIRHAAALIATFVALSGGSVSAETRTIKLIVPFPAGGGADVLTRTLSDRWAQTHGITNVIENR